MKHVLSRQSGRVCDDMIALLATDYSKRPTHAHDETSVVAALDQPRVRVLRIYRYWLLPSHLSGHPFSSHSSIYQDIQHLD